MDNGYNPFVKRDTPKINVDSQVSPYEKEPGDENKALVWGISLQAVKDKLIAPSTADFPFSYYGQDIKEVGTNSFVVKSYVDAQNAFGANVRQNFQVKLKKTSENSCDIISVSLN